MYKHHENFINLLGDDSLLHRKKKILYLKKNEREKCLRTKHRKPVFLDLKHFAASGLFLL